MPGRLLLSYEKKIVQLISSVWSYSWMQIQDRVAQDFKQNTRGEEVTHLNKGIFPERQVSTCRCCSTDLTAQADVATPFSGICYTKGKSFCEPYSRSRGCFCFSQCLLPQASPLGPSSLRQKRSQVAINAMLCQSPRAWKQEQHVKYRGDGPSAG